MPWTGKSPGTENSKTILEVMERYLEEVKVERDHWKALAMRLMYGAGVSNPLVESKPSPSGGGTGTAPDELMAWQDPRTYARDPYLSSTIQREAREAAREGLMVGNGRPLTESQDDIKTREDYERVLEEELRDSISSTQDLERGGEMPDEMGWG